MGPRGPPLPECSAQVRQRVSASLVPAALRDGRGPIRRAVPHSCPPPPANRQRWTRAPSTPSGGGAYRSHPPWIPAPKSFLDPGPSEPPCLLTGGVGTPVKQAAWDHKNGPATVPPIGDGGCSPSPLNKKTNGPPHGGAVSFFDGESRGTDARVGPHGRGEPRPSIVNIGVFWESKT